MYLVNTRRRNQDKTFGHKKMAKGRYRIYEVKKFSKGKEAKERKLADIPMDKDTLLLIHGFNNDFEDVTKAYLDFERRIRRERFHGNIIGFTWPSYGKWYKYFGDRGQVEYAATALLNFLLAYRPGLDRHSFHINTHSMGSRLLILALANYARIDAIPEAQRGSDLVDEVTFFAADLSNNSLEKNEDGYDAVQETGRLTSYFNPRDPVLGVSQFVNRDGRLGLNGAERPRHLPKNAFQVNCGTLIDNHAGYRKNTKIMRDLAAVLRGRPSRQIRGRRRMTAKNTFRVGPDPEEDHFPIDE